MSDKRTPLPDELRGQFRNLVNARCGLYFKDYDLKDLENAIQKRMEARRIDSPFTYYNTLMFSETKEDEIRELLNLLTIKHTYFFRNEPQFKALREKILPEIMEKKRRAADTEGTKRQAIRIWSAGCSTGEEPYSIAMVIENILPDPENWDIEIFATDASTEALEAARKGVYSVNSTRLVDKAHLSAYFTEQPKAGQDRRYVIKDGLRRMVNFSYCNLMDEDYPRGFDIIFCRNVTIYFELETTMRVMRKFEQSLNDDGYLFIGYSETLQFISDKFKMLDWEDAIFYVKEPEAARRMKAAPPPPPVRRREVEEVLEELSKAEFKAEEKARVTRPAKFDELLISAIKAIHSKEYAQSLAMIGEARSIDADAVEPYYLEAEVYMNQGRFKEAKTNLETALKKDGMFAPAYFLSGAIYAEEGKTEDAEKSFRKALYLEKEFPLAHFGLGNIYKQDGRVEAALREYRNTLDILSKSNPYDILPYSGGFTAAVLSSVCKNNIERLKITE